MGDPATYRYNWAGTRKHIDHAGEPDRWGYRPNTLCGQHHQSHVEARRRTSEAKLDKAPLCQHCAKKAGRLSRFTETDALSANPPNPARTER